LRQRVALVATLARLYVGVVLIDRERECRGHRRRIVGVVYDHMCQQQCDQRIGYAAGLRPGNMSQIGRVAPISHCGISIRLMSLVGQLQTFDAPTVEVHFTPVTGHRLPN
jgi:hypothetical protein